jgi:hypothetical protein
MSKSSAEIINVRRLDFELPVVSGGTPSPTELADILTPRTVPEMYIGLYDIAYNNALQEQAGNLVKHVAYGQTDVTNRTGNEYL